MIISEISLQLLSSGNTKGLKIIQSLIALFNPPRFGIAFGVHENLKQIKYFVCIHMIFNDTSFDLDIQVLLKPEGKSRT